MEIRCIVIEDERLALRKTLGFISKVNYLVLLASFDNAIDALNYLKNNSVDLIFLDIQMEDFSGIQFLEALKERPKVIITSAYESYALRSYDFEVTDYLLKPFTFDRFFQATERVHAALAGKNHVPGESVFVRVENKLEKINFADILYIEGKLEYLSIVTDKKKILTLQNFKSFESILPASFARIHKSFIVSVDRIESIERNQVKVGNTFIPIGETYKNALFDKIAILKKL